MLDFQIDREMVNCLRAAQRLKYYPTRIAQLERETSRSGPQMVKYEQNTDLNTARSSSLASPGTLAVGRVADLARPIARIACVVPLKGITTASKDGAA